MWIVTALLHQMGYARVFFLFFFQGSGEEVQKYVVPMRLPPCSSLDSIYVQTAEDVVFYLDFCGFLPGELRSWSAIAIRISRL